MLDKTTLIKGKNPLRKNKWLSGYLIMPLLITLLLSVFMTQCKEDDFEGEVTGVCPLVILTDPADGAVKVPLNKMITATFNEEMDPTTINATSFILMEGANSVSGTVTPVSGNKAAFNFTPTNPLKPSTLYTATMKRGVRDPMRNALQEDYVWSFTTIGQHTVALSSNPEDGGTTTGEGLYETDASVTIEAVAAEGYTFTNWTEGTDIVSTDAEYTFTITESRTLVANFTINKYTVALSSNPPLGGTTTGEGTYDSGDEVTVKAVPATGYTFKNWTEGGNIVSTTAEYKFTITKNRTLVANFEADIVQFNVMLSSNPPNGGTTTGGGTYNSGTSVTVKAVANTGYTFTNWTEGGNPVYSNANYTFTITGNRTLVANFTATPPSGPSIIDLTCAEPYAVLAGSTITNTGPSIINGDVGLSPGSALEGFPPGIINGVQQITTPAAADAKLCLTEAYLDGQGRSLNSISLPGNLGGLTLAPGLYTNSSTTGITGTGANGILTLDAQGNANAVWIFQIGSTLTTDPATSIVLAGGAQAKNIFWIVGSSATLGTNSVFYGNILADQSITLNTGAVLNGRALTQIAAVTLDASTINKP